MINENDVKELRSALGISQKELAEKLGVSTRTIANYEAGGVIPMNKQMMIEGMLSNARNVNITGDGNISNTGTMDGYVSISIKKENDGRFVLPDGVDDLIIDSNLPKEVYRKILQILSRQKRLEEENEQLKKDKAILQEFVTFLQNKK